MHGLYVVTMYIMVLCLVVSPTNVHLPNLLLPYVVILLWIVFAMICKHPPGLYAFVDLIALVVVTILEFGRCLLIVLIKSYRVRD